MHRSQPIPSTLSSNPLRHSPHLQAFKDGAVTTHKHEHVDSSQTQLCCQLAGVSCMLRDQPGEGHASSILQHWCNLLLEQLG
jgi:hypothetical protein